MPPRKYTAENNRIARARFAKESRDPKRDIARKAKMAKSIEDYDPRRNDWKGVDTPGSSLPGKGGRGKSGAAAAWRAHVMATHRQMGGSLKDAMRAASKTWIKKGGDPFTNFMAAGGTGTESQLPPYPADGWKGEVYQDKTGAMWQSLPDESGVYHWVKSSAPVTAPLPTIPAQYKAKPLPSIPAAYGPAKKPLPGIPAPVTLPLPVISTNTAGFEDIPSPVYNDAIDDEEGFRDAIDDEEGFKDVPDEEVPKFEDVFTEEEDVPKFDDVFKEEEEVPAFGDVFKEEVPQKPKPLPQVPASAPPMEKEIAVALKQTEEAENRIRAMRENLRARQEARLRQWADDYDADDDYVPEQQEDAPVRVGILPSIGAFFSGAKKTLFS